jgi:hypothetical protein
LENSSEDIVTRKTCDLGYGESTSNLKSDIIKVDPIVYVENPIHHEDGDSNYPLLE